jgi:histidinol dehydrogenase
MKNINVYKYTTLKSEDIENLCKRAESDLSEYNKVVDGIIENVRKNKDKALREYSLSLDKVEQSLNTFKVSDEEFDKASNILEPDFKETLKFCSENVKKFHKKQMPKKNG